MTTKFWMVCEDPMYDEDGVMVDEDFEEYEEPSGWHDISVPIEDLSPFQTINS